MAGKGTGACICVSSGSAMAEQSEQLRKLTTMLGLAHAAPAHD